jgi:hypothetical protein
MTSPLRAPFPYFGGKTRVAHLVWDAFGPDVPNREVQQGSLFAGDS